VHAWFHGNDGVQTMMSMLMMRMLMMMMLAAKKERRCKRIPGVDDR